MTSETGAFVIRSWDLTPGALNPDFYELTFTRALHSSSAAYEVTVRNGSPTPLHLLVEDDIDHEGRPSAGSLPHTDRDADQVDPGVLGTGVPWTYSGTGLRAAPLVDPARSIALRYASSDAGVLLVEVFGAAGRLLWPYGLTVRAGAAGVLSGPPVGAAGVAFYRVQLLGAGGSTRPVCGRMVLLR